MKKYITRYGIWGLIKLSISVIRTKIFYPKARLIRFPFDIRNRHLIDLGIGLTTGVGCRIEAHPLDHEKTNKCIEFGENVEINDYVHIAAGEKVTIGNNVLIASKVFISDINHGNYSGANQDNPLTVPHKRTLSTNPVFIDDNVWIGEFVSILPGVTIGKGTIIGANSVVCKNLPPNVVAVGSPAKPIKMFNFNTQRWEKI